MRAHLHALPRDKHALANGLLQQAKAELHRTDREAEQALRKNTPARNLEVISRERALANTLKHLFDAYTMADGPILQRSLQMHTHGHTLFVSAQGGKLVVELASRRTLLYHLIVTAIDKETENAKRDTLIRKLEALKQRAITLLKAVTARSHPDTFRYDQDRMSDHAIETETDDIVDRLVQIGQEFEIDDLANLGAGSHYVERGEIKNDPPEFYRKNWRSTFYPSFSTDVAGPWKSRELAKLKEGAPAGAGSASQFWCVGAKNITKAHWAPSADAEIDHVHEVVKHWNGEGHNRTQAERDQWYNDKNNLQLLCCDCNKAKNKGIPKMVPTVGPRFRGKLDNPL
jgi:hypothetical protein